MSLVLVVDDVPAMCEAYAYDLKREGKFETMTATDGRRALGILEEEPVECVVLDLEMPGFDGFQVLDAIRKRGHELPVIVYTNTGNFDRCVRAMKLGAYSFIDKKEPMERVVREIENALEQGRLASEVSTLRARLEGESTLVGESRSMRRLKEQIAKLAPIPSPVLITGESGTGKELVARELHRGSGRKGSFLAINCAALPENLVESELFGHERGAFTGAERTRKGAFEATTGGTLFLDEIGELDLPVQAKMLRVLEEEEIVRVGGSRTFRVDSRVVAATNRDLDKEAGEKRFREDLFYRLNVHVIAVPPLRERLADIPLLVDHFLGDTCSRLGARPKTVAPDVIEALQGYGWKRNNVRELRNIIERMIIASSGDTIEAEDVPSEIVDGDAESSPGDAKSFKQLKREAERQIVLTALDRNDWHITRTAEELGLADHSALLKIMRRHGLKKS